MRVDQGQSVRLSFEFRQSGTVFDPTVVKASVRKPGGKVVTYVYGTDAALVKDSTGSYHLDLLCHLPGLWHYRGFTETSGQECADEQQIVVIQAQAVQKP